MTNRILPAVLLLAFVAPTAFAQGDAVAQSKVYSQTKPAQAPAHHDEPRATPPADADDPASDDAIRRRRTPSSDRWIFVGETTDPVTDVFLDKQTAKRDGNVVTAWDKTVFAQPEPFRDSRSRANLSYDERTSLISYNCSTRQRSILSGLFKLKDNVVEMDTNYEIEPQNVVPDSIGEATLEAACKL